ncbi:integrase [Jiella sp. M17.18]|uniref:integrase n=1 Tax=Jiella sp. M17.18 TaxID=3234247 RepID=UPI0034E05363
MPRHRKPARLWLEPERRSRDGRVTEAAVWKIKDGKIRISTGCHADNHAGAEAALQAYLAKRHADAEPVRDKAAADTAIADVVRHYVENRSDRISDPDLLLYRAGRLTEFWGDRSLADIDGRTCREYAKWRGSEPSARRELEDLRAAIRLYAADGLCRENVVVTTPGKPQSRTDFLTRDQAAALIWYLWKTREKQHGRETKRFPLRHIVGFVLVGIYTGTRSRRIWTASFEREEGLPWLDLDGGVFYRAAQGESVSPTKRAGSVRIPPRLLAFLRMWRRGPLVEGVRRPRRYLVEYRGKPSDPKKALARAMDEVYGEGHPYVRHTLRHTCATWLMWSGEDIGDIASYLSMTRDVLLKVYGHEHPDADRDVGLAFNRRAGRRKKAS